MVAFTDADMRKHADRSWHQRTAGRGKTGLIKYVLGRGLMTTICLMACSVSVCALARLSAHLKG